MRFLHGDVEISVSQILVVDWDLTGSLSIDGTPVNPEELSRAVCLLRSRFWRATRQGGRSLFITTAAHIREIEDHPEKQNSDLKSRFSLFAMEDAIAEAAALTFQQKALNTLENLHDLWRSQRRLPEVPYSFFNIENELRFRDRPPGTEDGMAYGCDELDAFMVYQWLVAENYLDAGYQRLDITPKGVVEVERIRSGKEASLKRGFFIRKWDEELDSFFRPIMEEVAEVTGCEIAAVWEREKNAKIDELILRRIREASVIVLDVTGERFNVGLEAGYAMALRKQIVLIADESLREKLPFDIRTLNCFFYRQDEPKRLTEKLTERVLDALEEARLGTH